MEPLIHRVFFHQWPQKLIAIVTALILWMIVNQSILAVKIIPFVPIRVINLPEDKTIQGLLSNGVLSKRATLTLTGTKDVIEQLEPGDLEVVVDVSNLPYEGIVQITKKNLVSLNPNVNLLNHISQVTHPEFIIKMSPLLSAKIPVHIQIIGEPPEGYEYLDYWPLSLIHTVTGPQDQVLNLQNNGLELTFDLSLITKQQLDALRREKSDAKYHDEVAFMVPQVWKKVVLPFLNNVPEYLNDSDTKNLQIDFLAKEWHPIKRDLPINVFYPLKTGNLINPITFPLALNEFIKRKNEIQVLAIPLLAYHVSQLFLDYVQDSIEINITAAPQSEKERLEWSVEFVNESALEDGFAALEKTKIQKARQHEREEFLRKRFRYYMQRFTLYVSPQHALSLDSMLQENQINVRVPYAK